MSVKDSYKHENISIYFVKQFQKIANNIKNFENNESENSFINYRVHKVEIFVAVEVAIIECVNDFLEICLESIQSPETNDYLKKIQKSCKNIIHYLDKINQVTAKSMIYVRKKEISHEINKIIIELSKVTDVILNDYKNYE